MQSQKKITTKMTADVPRLLKYMVQSIIRALKDKEKWPIIESANSHRFMTT